VITGRGKELAELRAVAAQLLVRKQGTAIVVLSGMSGIGKTTLATAIAREYRARFDRSGQWDFLRYSGSGQREPGTGLAHLLRNVAGLSAEQLPEDQSDDERDSQRELRWQDWASAHPTLLVLENVSSFAQVRGLIPAEGRHLVLMTSRRNDLHCLPAISCTFIRLEFLSEADSLSLFEEVAGRELAGAAGPRAAELVGLAGGLPLAVCVLAAAVRTRSSTVSHLLAECTASGGTHALIELIDEKGAGTGGISAALDVAFGQLSMTARRIFCLLAQHPLGRDMDAGAARALSGSAHLERDLRQLCEASLLHLDGPDGPDGPRYQMHELVREYARRKILDPCSGISGNEADAAAERLLAHYWSAAREQAARAEPWLSRHTRPGAAAGSGPATRPRWVPSPGPSGPELRTASLAWFEEHRELLMACIDYARDQSLDQWVVRLTGVMAGFLRNNGPWDQAISQHAAAAAAAGRLGDQAARGVALNDLGIMSRLAGRLGEAMEALTSSCAIFAGAAACERGSLIGQANALNEQGIVLNELRDHAGALIVLARALCLYREAGDAIGIANASKNLGVAEYHAGFSRGEVGLRSQALVLLEDAFRGYADIGDELGQAEVCNHRGRLHLRAGDIAAARADFRHARDWVSRAGGLLETARASEGLGLCCQAVGDSVQARKYLERAGQVFADIRAEPACLRVGAALDPDRPRPGPP
jgi:tetratricopeptide (TPR) repeat protein